jgi:hypothetical protein
VRRQIEETSGKNAYPRNEFEAKESFTKYEFFYLLLTALLVLLLTARPNKQQSRQNRRIYLTSFSEP